MFALRGLCCRVPYQEIFVWPEAVKIFSYIVIQKLCFNFHL